MRKVRVYNIFINILRIRRRRNMIREGMDSNLLSVETFLAHFNIIILLRVNPRRKNQWEKGNTTNQMLGM
jgi:hypothetical protein